MATALNVETFTLPNGTNSPDILSLNSDPSSTGLSAAVGSICLRTDSAGLYVKTGSLDVNWTLLPTATPPTEFVSGWMGDGSDGTATLSTSQTLSRDMFYQDLTVDAGVTLNPGGCRVFVKGRLTLNGNISAAGGNGGAASGANGGSAGTAGTPFGTGFLGSSGAGGAGAMGGGFSPGGAGASNSAPSRFVTNTAGSGAAGLTGGGGGGGNGGGGGGAVVAVSAQQGDIHAITLAINGSTGRATFGLSSLTAGSGGGGGGTVVSGPNKGGGGGGGGGGYVAVCAHEIVGTGSISARGGDGGAGETGNTTGGGGGGAGGVVVVVVDIGNIPNLDASGGAGGAGSLGGSTNGGAGGNGITVQYKLST